MSNKNMTAVEWLIDRLNQHQFLGMYCEDSEIELRTFAYNEIIELAKNIGRQQIKDAYVFGLQDEYVIGSEQYYKKTYEK